MFVGVNRRNQADVQLIIFFGISGPNLEKHKLHDVSTISYLVLSRHMCSVTISLRMPESSAAL